MGSSNASVNDRGELIDVFNSTTKLLTTLQLIFISDQASLYTHIAVSIVFGGFLSIAGIVSNTINVIIFHKQGIKDSVTVSYASLSFWDGCLCLMTLMIIVLLTIEKMFPMRQIDFSAVSYVYIAYARSVTHIMSTLITVYVSIELCICFMIPLKVKLIFTKTRAVMTHLAMFVFTVACNCSAWATQDLRWKFDPRFNSSRLGLWLAKERPAVEIFLAIFTGNVIQVTAQTVSVVCAVLLISGIQKSTRFRNQSVHNSIKIKESVASKSSDSLPTVSSIVVTKQSSSRKKVKSKQYTKLARMTVVITILFLVFNIPVMVVSLSRTIVPDLSKNTNLFSLLYVVVYASTLINANTSICVYYKGSSRFRNLFRALMFTASRT